MAREPTADAWVYVPDAPKFRGETTGWIRDTYDCAGVWRVYNVKETDDGWFADLYKENESNGNLEESKWTAHGRTAGDAMRAVDRHFRSVVARQRRKGYCR